MTGPLIRRVDPDAWRILKEVRLAALVDSPDAFATNLAEAEAYDDDVWKWRALTGSTGSDQATFLLTSGDTGLGMITGLTVQDPPGACQVVGTWVAPSVRGLGYGRELTNTLIRWAARAGFSEMRLWVTTTNAEAVCLYRSTGFVPIGRTKPLPSNPQLEEALYYQPLNQSVA